MTGTPSRGDDLLRSALEHLYDHEVARARDDLALAPLAAETRSHLAVSAGSIAAVVLIIGLVVLVAPRLAYLMTNGVGTGTGPTPSGSTLPTPSGTEPSGLPGAIQGQRVLTPDEAESLVAQSSEGVQFLVGGWLHAAASMSCPVGSDPWQPCHALPLYAARSGGRAMFVYGIERIGPVDLPPVGSVTAIVLSVHTYDAACDKQACLALPVVDATVWVGAQMTASYVAPAQPSPGVDATQAETAARTLVPRCETWSHTGTSAGTFGDLVPAGGDLAGDRWVWAVTFESSSPHNGAASPSGTEVCPAGLQRAVVYVDYVNGMPLEADVVPLASPAPGG